jgi:hypothetical protein
VWKLFHTRYNKGFHTNSSTAEVVATRVLKQTLQAGFPLLLIPILVAAKEEAGTL